MGQFPTNDGIVGQAMPLTAAMIASIDVRPAWLFQNSGTLGTNLDSSVIYCGNMPADASIVVILPGTVGPSVISGFVSPGYAGSGGTDYENGPRFNIDTKGGSGTGLTVNYTAVNGAIETVEINANSADVGYLNGDLIEIDPQGADPGFGATFRIVAEPGLPTAAQGVKFEGLQSGSILPVCVDFVTAVAGTGVSVADFIVCK